MVQPFLSITWPNAHFIKHLNGGHNGATLVSTGYLSFVGMHFGRSALSVKRLFMY